MSGTAKLVKYLDKWRGDARLYELSPPYKEWDDKLISHVVVSAVDVYGKPETYIFQSDDDAQEIDYSELEGSFQGGLDHEQALRGLGYDVVPA